MFATWRLSPDALGLSIDGLCFQKGLLRPFRVKHEGVGWLGCGISNNNRVCECTGLPNIYFLKTPGGRSTRPALTRST